MKKSFILWFLFLGILTVSSGDPSTYGCGLPKTCDSALLNKWFKDNPVFTHEFKIVQTIVIQTPNSRSGQSSEDDSNEETEGSSSDRAGDNYSNNQTATIKGKLELSRGTGNLSCSGFFTVTTATIHFHNVSDVETEDGEETFGFLEQPLILEGPTVYPFIFQNFSSEDGHMIRDAHSICVPDGEDGWKSNLRRTLVFMLTTNFKTYIDLKISKNFPVFLDGKKNSLVGFDFFGAKNKGGVTNYIHWDSNNITTLRLTSHAKGPRSFDFQTISQEMQSQFQNNSVIDGMKTKTSEENHEKYVQKWLSKLETHSNFGLVTCLQSLYKGLAQCNEYQRAATQSSLAVDISTNSELRLIPSKNRMQSTHWNPDEIQLNKISMEFDTHIRGPSVDTVIAQGFQKLTREMCDHIGTPKAILDVGGKMRRILPHVSIKVLRDQYSALHTGSSRNCISAFLDFVASSTQSDDTVEFMVELITKEDEAINDQIFSTFLWTATLMPTAEYDDFQRYATSKTNIALQKLFDIQKLYHRKYGMTDSVFFIHMAALLNKGQKITQEIWDTNSIDELLPRVEYILEMGKFIKKLEQNNATDIDRGTHLVIRRAMERHGQQLDPDDDTELESDYERLETHNPCSTKYASYLEKMFEDDKKKADLKIMAYLWMRKCYTTEWRELVKEYVVAEEANKDVVNFIVQHIDAIFESYKSQENANDEEAVVGLANPSGANVNSSMGFTKFYTMDLDAKLYGHSGVRKAQTGVEVNVVYGSNFIPRLIAAELRTFGNDGEQTVLELQLLRLESNTPGNSEIFITYTGNGVTMFATTIVFDQGKLIQLLQNAIESEYLEFIRSFSITNRKALAQLFQNKKLEIFRRFLLQETRRSFPSISGLPVITNLKMDLLFNFNFTHHYGPTADGDLSYTFRLSSGISLQGIEEISMGLGHGEILGYQLRSGVSLNRDLELILSRSRNGVFKAKIGMGRDNSEEQYFEFDSFDLFKLERFQVANGFTEIKKSGHIWKPRKASDALGEGDLDLGKSTDLFEGRVCKFPREIQGFAGSGPLYISGSLSCDLPSAIVIEVAPKFKGSPAQPLTVNEASLEVKIYPEGGKPLDHVPEYLWIISGTKSPGNSLKFINVRAGLITPSKHYGLNVTLQLGSETPEDPDIKSLMINYESPRGSYGFEMYKRKWNSWNQYQGSLPAPLTRRKREILEFDGKSTFGLVVWTPYPGYENVKVFVGESYGNGENTMHSIIKSKGVHPYLNSKMEFILNVKEVENINITVFGVDHPVPLARWIQVSLEIENELLGKISLTASILNYPFRFLFDPINRMNGVVEFSYGRYQWPPNKITGDFSVLVKSSSTEEDDEDKREGWTLNKKAVLGADVKFSEFPNLDFKFLTKIRGLVTGTDKNKPNCIREDYKFLGEITPGRRALDNTQRVTWHYLEDVDKNGQMDDGGCPVLTYSRKTDVHLPGVGVFRYHKFTDGLDVTEIKLFEIGAHLVGRGLQGYGGILYEKDETSDPVPRPRLRLRVSYNDSATENKGHMEHELVQVSDTSIDYVGSLVIPKMSTLNLTGVLQPIVPGGWLTYNAFNVTITDATVGQSVEYSQYTLSMNEIVDESVKKHYKLLLVGKDTTFDSSVKLLKAKSAEGYLIAVKSNLKNVFHLTADLGAGNLHFVFEGDNNPIVNVKIEGKIGWPASLKFKDDETKVLSVKFDVTNSDPKWKGYESLLHLSSVSEFKWINETESMIWFRNYLSTFNKTLPHNFLVTSKFTGSEFQTPALSWDLLYQFHPHEERQRPVLSAVAFVGHTLDKYSLQVFAQGQARTDGKNIIIGEWWQLERPSRSFLTFSSVVTFIEQHATTRVGTSDVFFQGGGSFKHELKMDNQGFFCPDTNTSISITTGWKRTGDHWAVYEGVKLVPEMEDVVFRNSSMSLIGELSLKLGLDGASAEKNISGGVSSMSNEHWIENVYSAQHSSHTGRRDDFKITHNVTHLPEDPTRFLDPTPPRDGVAYHVRDFVDAFGWNDISRRIGWRWERQAAYSDRYEVYGDGGIKIAEGHHQFDMLFENFRHFELQAQHFVKSDILGDLSWQDKIYSKFSPTEGNWGALSSKLISVSATKKPDHFEALAEILHPYIRSKANYTFKKIHPTAQDPFRRGIFSFRCVSVILDEDIVLELDAGVWEKENGVEYKDNVFYAIPLPYQSTASIISHWKQTRETVGHMSADLVTRKGSTTFPGDYTEKYDWSCASMILHDGIDHNNPVFLHYEYSIGFWNAILKGQDPLLVRSREGSFSSGTTLEPTQQFLQVAMHKDSNRSDGFRIENNARLEIRLGHLLPGPELNPICIGGVKGYDFEKYEDVFTLWKSKLHCQYDCHAPEDDCVDSVGRVLLHSETREDSDDHSELTINHDFQALWQDDGKCSLNTLWKGERINGTKPDKVCTSVLKEFGGCWAGLKEAQCNKIGMSKGVKLWKREVRKMNPMVISRIVDPLAVVWVWATK